MTIQSIHDYTLSTGELAMALSLANRPDLGRMVIIDNLGELSQSAMEEHLRAASHSLLARKFATIGKSGMATLDDELQDTLAPLMLFDGMIQMVVSDPLPLITNFHFGGKGRFTAHWVEQGVVHRMILAELRHLPQIASELASLPQKIPAKFESQIMESNFIVSMDAFAELGGMEFDAGAGLLIEHGLNSQLARALMSDLLEPAKRGSVTFLPIDSKHLGRELPPLNAAGIFFVTGKSSWIFTFPATGEPQVGSLAAGGADTFEECIRQLVEEKSNAFR